MTSEARATNGRVRHAGARSFLRLFLVITAVLLVVRLALPTVVRRYVLHVLNEMPQYRAAIDELDLNLWRGSYEIEGLVLDKVHGGEAAPFLKVRLVDLSIEWLALAYGEVVGEIDLHEPALQATIAHDDRAETGTAPDWPEYIKQLFPFRIDRFTVRDGELHLKNVTTEPQVDLLMSDFYLEVLNLTNVRGHSRSLVAEAEAAGRPLGEGEFEARLFFDPLAEPMRFDLDAELRGIPVVELNDFLQAYGNVDAESGTFSAFAEFAVSNGRVEGYVKTLFEDLKVLSVGEIDDPQDALEFLWEGLVGLASEVLENQPHDRLAMKIPLRGELGQVEADMLGTIASVLGNSFVAALRPAIDDSIELRGLQIVEKEDEP